MNQIGKQQFNGISIFSTNAATATAGVLSHNASQDYGGGGTYETSPERCIQHQVKLRTEVYHSMLVNLEFVLSMNATTEQIWSLFCKTLHRKLDGLRF